jgi:hypothetical protein
MPLCFVKLCNLMLTEAEVLEEANKSELDKLSREAYQAYLRKQQATTKDQAAEQIAILFRIRKQFIEEAKKPDLYSNLEKTDEQVEELMKTRAMDEVGEHPRRKGTHYITWNYLNKFVGYLQQ